MEDNNLIYIVSDSDAGGRADKYLGGVCSEFSRSRLRGLIDDGHVLLNGDVLKAASVKTREGDVFKVSVPDAVSCAPQPEDIPLDVVYEDEDIIVINKPAGLVVHPGAGNWSGTLVNALLYHCGDSLSGIGGVVRPGIVHRLDKDTSGLMMAAKNDYAHKHLSAQLADRSLRRVYHALVLGVPMPIKGSVDRPIGRHRHNRVKMSVMSNAPREARTHYLVLDDFAGACSLVECKLESGRTHQIRVHMEAIGHPVLGDPLYSAQQTKLISYFRNSNYSVDLINEILSLNRQALHAKEISFIHPRSEKVLFFSSDISEDLFNILNLLNK